jgi:hypothetical protein
VPLNLAKLSVGGSFPSRARQQGSKCIFQAFILQSRFPIPEETGKAHFFLLKFINSETNIWIITRYGMKRSEAILLGYEGFSSIPAVSQPTPG